MNYKKSFENTANQAILYAQDKFGLSFDVANYIYHLGYKTEQEIEDYINPTNAIFHNPFLFPDMQKVVDKINNAIQNKKRILIYGDYDVDGIGSTYILVKYFEEIGIKVNYFLPSRYKDGYGLTIGSIDKVISEFSPELIITVDCGITSIEEVKYLKQKGIDIIITDHHEPLDVLPDCLVLDCKIKEQPYPFKFLCGAGMALKLVQALSDEQTCKKYMTVCAISTISDIVELVDENRYIVKEGLKNYNTDCPDGVKYLVKQCKVFGVPSSKDISFKVAPKLNATGRMGDASISLKLYLAKTDADIKKYCKQTIKMNEQRQTLCNTIFDDAVAMIDEKANLDKIIVLQKPEWECGILGIVCSKIVEKYHKPTILFGLDDRTGNLSGSARSFASFDLHNAISQNSSLLTTFGGHKMACGLALEQKNYEEFAVAMQNTIQEEDSIDEEGLYDIDLNPNQINMDFVNHLSLLEPFGVANPEPTFRVKVNSVTVSPMPSHFEHLLVEIQKSSGVYFNNSNNIYTLSFNNKKHLYVNINKEYFLSKPIIKTFIKDIESKDYIPFNKSICEGAFNSLSLYNSENQAKYSENYSYNKKANTIYVVYKKEVSNLYYENVCYVNFASQQKSKTLLVCPLDFSNLEEADELVFLDELENTNIISVLNKMYPDLNVYAKVCKNNSPIHIKTEQIKSVYNLISNIKENVFDEIYLFKKYFGKLNYSFSTFICIYRLLEQTGQIVFDKNVFTISTAKSLDEQKIISYCSTNSVVLE